MGEVKEEYQGACQLPFIIYFSYIIIVIIVLLYVVAISTALDT